MFTRIRSIAISLLCFFRIGISLKQFLKNRGRLIPRSFYLATFIIISIAVASPPTEHSAQKYSPSVQASVRTAVPAWSISDNSEVESGSGTGPVLLNATIADGQAIAMIVDNDSPAADISFIKGFWSGRISGACLNMIFQADNDTDVSGNLEVADCGNPFDVCSFAGTVQNKNVNLTFSCAEEDLLSMNLTLNDSFTGMTGTAETSTGTLNVTLTKYVLPIGFHDVSVSSGIANNSVQTTGVQWIDYNSDGKLDLYLVGHNGNVLFKNAGNGKFVDVTKKTKTGNNGKDAGGASWADIDNDGDPDVFITNATGAPTLLLNKKKVFQDISSKIDTAAANASAGFSIRAGIWVDINNDRKSDLFVIFDGAKNQLFKQTGSLAFNDITPTSGFADRTGAGRSAIAADLNEDGFQDLYVIDYDESNILYKNNGNETFSDVTRSADVGFNEKSVQATLADYDNDRDLDIYVVNRAGPPVLYENLGNLKFKDSTSRRLKKAKKGRAAAFFDIDNDQDQDLIVAQLKAKNLVFENLGSGKFKVKKGIDLSRPDNPVGIAVGDFNGDLIPDIIIGDADAEQENGDSLFQNIGAGGNNALQLVLRGTKSPRDAVGARIVIQTGLTFQTRSVTSGNGKGQDSLPVNFGLGPYEIVDSIQILWPSGTVQFMNDVDANKTYKIIEE